VVQPKRRRSKCVTTKKNTQPTMDYPKGEKLVLRETEREES